MKKRSSEIELHIISPHRWLSEIKEFEIDNIYYHFFNQGIPWYGHDWPEYFRWDAFTDFRSNRKKILKFVKSINPDIIHWHGAENAYFTSAFLDLMNSYPHLLTIQGWISLKLRSFAETNQKTAYYDKKRNQYEKKIISEAKNFGVRDKFMKNEVLKYQPDANFYWHEYFINLPSNDDTKLLDQEKIYDIIFFTRIIKSKGIEDLIIAVSRIKKKYPDIKLAVLGSSQPDYIEYLKTITRKINCHNNVDFKGFIRSQEEVYHILHKTKLFVMPAYVGMFPGE